MSSIKQSNQSNNQALDILITAKSIIKNKGWGQGAMHNVKASEDNSKWERCNYCMTGALYEAEIMIEPLGSSYKLSHNALAEACGGSIIQYNDKDGRTKDEVLDVFDRAIAKIKAGEANA